MMRAACDAFELAQEVLTGIDMNDFGTQIDIIDKSSCQLMVKLEITLRHEGATTLQQECHWKSLAELRRRLCPRLLLFREKTFHLTGMRGKQSLAFASAKHRHFF